MVVWGLQQFKNGKWGFVFNTTGEITHYPLRQIAVAHAVEHPDHNSAFKIVRFEEDLEPTIQELFHDDISIDAPLIEEVPVDQGAPIGTGKDIPTPKKKKTAKAKTK
jgi:hypothetical protein